MSLKLNKQNFKINNAFRCKFNRHAVLNNLKSWKKVKKDVAPQAVTHLSTNHDRRCLTWAIGREPLLSTWYGKRQPLSKLIVHFTLGCTVLARMSDTGRNRAGLSNAGVTYLGQRLLRFAINTTNQGLFQIRCQYILVRRAKMYWHSVWKSPVFFPF